MGVDSLSIFGLVGASVLFYVYSQEFKKENNIPLYYFCFTISSLFIPAMVHSSYLAVNMTSSLSIPAEASAINFFESMSTTTLISWFVLFFVMGLFIIRNFLTSKTRDAYEKLTENNRERRV